MAKSCKFQIEKEQESNDCGQVWTDTGNSRKIAGQDPVDKYSPDCGWSDSFMFEWFTVSDEYICNGYDKYTKKMQRVSYNLGEDWEVVPGSETIGTLVEKNSSYCDECPEYRWTPSGYTCIGYDKWEQSVKEVSYDSGTTWSAVTPTETSATSLVEVNSEYCGYVPPAPPFDGKWKATYTGSISSAACGSSSAISSNEITLEDLISVEIGQCVTNISNSAFYDCTSLTSVTIPNNVTSIGRYAFTYCSSLTSCTIGSGVTSIGSSAFQSCSSLQSITIPDSVTSISENLFNGCSSLTSCTIGSGVTIISNQAFRNCNSLTSVDIPNNVTSIGENAFGWCTGLTSVIIPNSVTSIGDYAFYSCNNLTSVTIPSGVTSIGSQVFYGCSSFTSITIPSGITSIGSSAFYNCRGLQSITVEALVPPTLGSNAFSGTNESPINVPAGSLETYKQASGWSNYASRIQAIQ